MQAPAKRGLWIVLATLAAVALVAFVASCQWGKPAGPRLPAFAAAEVTLRDPTKGPVTTSLDPADVARLRTELEGAKRDQGAKWVVAGYIRLFQAGVEVQQIYLFCNGAGLMPFRIGGEYYLPKPGGLMRDLLYASNLPRR